MPLPTTRYERYVFRRDRYMRRRRKWWSKKWKSHKDPVTDERTYYPGDVNPPGPKQLPPYVSSKSYTAVPFDTVGFLSWTVTADGFARPPFITITSPWYIFMRSLGDHQRQAYLRYHCRRVRAFGGRTVRRKATALDRQITGCNYFYFRNQFYKDTDVLGRHPTESEVADGASPGPPGWPSPLGY